MLFTRIDRVEILKTKSKYFFYNKNIIFNVSINKNYFKK